MSLSKTLDVNYLRRAMADQADAESDKGSAITAFVVGIILFSMGLPLLIIGSISTGEDKMAMLAPGAILFGIGAFVTVVALVFHREDSVHHQEDDEAPDWVKNNPSELRAIAASAFGGFIVTELFHFMWYEGTSCGVWGNDYSCMGSVWLTLAYVAILSTALAPGIWGGVSMFAKNFTYVSDQQRGEVALLAAFGLPFAAIWATIWLYCLPTTWTLLPWGSWETNWWKIFPYIFGLSWWGLGPLFATIQGIGGKFKEFAEAEKRTHEFQEDFKDKLAASSDETMKFEFSDLPLTKESGEEATSSKYVFVPEEMSWKEHNERAVAMGGHLATITSAEENEQVTNIADGKTVWIGGIRKGGLSASFAAGADHWYWSDGQPWTYTNWHPGEPNNWGGGENRVHLGLQAPGTWNDVGEGWRGPAVYQMSETASTESNPPQFTSILGDMDIQDKYKK